MTKRALVTTHWPALAAAAFGLAISPAAFAAEIAVRQIGPSQFEFRLTESGSITEHEALGLLAEPAAQVCNGLRPVPGKYRFEARQPLGGAAAVEPGGLVLYQEVSCESGPAPAVEERPPTLSSPEEAREAEAEVARLTEQHFALIADGKFEQAYANKATAVTGEDRAEWIDGARAFHDAAGKPVRLEVIKTTVYDNPAEAPESGLYVAADFVNAFANAPYHCGYLMWFRPVGGEFRISREETGTISAESLKTIPADQLDELKRRMRCTLP